MNMRAAAAEEHAGFDYRASRGPRCPHCQGATRRIRRRYVDVLISLFIPVRRFRCQSSECGWEGNLRAKRFFLLK